MQFRPTKNAYTGAKNKLFLKPLEAWSYSWWKYLSVEKGLVVFNNNNYSSTTNGHQSETRGLLRKHRIKIDLMVDVRCGLQSSEWTRKEVERLHSVVLLAEFKMQRKGIRPNQVKEFQGEIKAAKASLKKMQRFKVKFTKADAKALKASVEASETARLERNRKASAAKRAQRKAMEAANAEALADLKPVAIMEAFDKVNSLEAL